MKNLIYKSLFILLIFNSCEIDRLPYTAKETEDLLSSEGGLEAATLGNYAILKGANGFGPMLHRIAEYAGDNVSLSGSTTDNIFYWYNYQNITTNGRSNSFWITSYKAILGINKVLELTEEGVSPEKDQLIGENYYLRALVNYGLVNAFARPYSQNPSAPGIPLKLTSDVNTLPERATVEEVYQQILADLEKAESLMTISKPPSYASKWAAKALLSRVHLYMEHNEEAIAYATEIIESGEYSLVPTSNFADYFKMAPESNSETIFAFKMDKDSDYETPWATVGSLYANIQGVGWGEMYASSSYLNLINKHPEDVRKDFIDPQYLLDENGQKIPVVYWVDADYNYVFKPTYTEGGNLYFDDNGTRRRVMEESDGEHTTYFFTNSNGEKIEVTKSFDMEKRNGYPKFYVLKASLQEEVPQLWSPVISRLAEMYLNRAEANAKLGKVQLASEDVNVIRERAGIPPYSDASEFPEGMDILDIVLQERRLEFAFEGHRKFDVFRNNRTMNRRYPGTHLNGNDPYFEIQPTDDRVILYIPESQIIVQPSLTQNP